MVIKVNLKQLSLRNPKWFFKALDLLKSHPSLELELSKTTDVEPSGHALMELLIEEARGRQKKISFKHYKPLPLPVHENGFSLGWFESAIFPAFFERFSEGHLLDEELLFDLRLLFSELTQNAKDHSGSEKFLVLLSPREIGVFDLGVSIPAKLEQKYSFTGDIGALLLSLKKGITTRRIRPGGFGLFYTLSLLRRAREGYLYIASRNAQVRFYLKNKKIDRKELALKMPGTLIYCRLGKETP